MVQKYKSPIRVYKYPFELVMKAYEKRFPTCDMIPIFVGSEIIHEEESDDGAVQIIERRCKLNVEAPYLLKKMSGIDYFYCIQRNTLDRRKRTLVIEAWNESFASRIHIKEYCTYYVHPENAEWTCFEQSASLEVKSFYGLESAVEKLAAKHYAANVNKGKEIIEYHIEELRKQDITYVPPYVDQITSNSCNNEKESIHYPTANNYSAII
ncbi:SEC14-like protein 1 [Tetranychus urticae]|uniref:SEC14-like protein 1 n=1 Tax=Tetranychus urticae TaxID=32264 RepID=UPI00077BE46F|nr:SEC14-like protein 1 [Tetranychus urticae]